MAFKNPGVIGNNYSAWVKELSEAKKIFDQAGIKYWIDMGTILGALRNGEFIKWDNDIDFSCEITEASKVFAIIPKFSCRGYKVVITDSEIYFDGPGYISIGMAFYRITNDKIWIIWLEKYSKLKFITRHFKRVAERIMYRDYHYELPKLERWLYQIIPQRWLWPIRKFLINICLGIGEKSYAMVFPRNMIDQLETVTLCGMNFNAPSPVEKYVSMIYGQGWRVPDKKWQWDQVEALDINFFNQHQRINYHLLNHISNGKEDRRTV